MSYKKLILFLILNFGALGVGSLLMQQGPTSIWYINLNQAPWTPPGWVFGAAWFTIMICFSFYMTYLCQVGQQNTLRIEFALQWLLNVSWNGIFFYLHYTTLGLTIIALLTILIFYFFVKYYQKMKLKSLLILPYFIWLVIACSLNLYIVLYN